MDKAKKSDLGNIIFEAKPNMTHRIGLIVISLFLVLPVLIIFAAAADADDPMPIEALLIMSPFLLLPLYFIVNLILGFGERLTFYQKGIEKRGYLKSYRGTWDDLQQMRTRNINVRVNGIPFHFFKVTLQAKDGTTFGIGKVFANYEGILKYFLDNLVPQWANEDLAVLRAGQTIQYGKITATQEGIQKGNNRNFYWDEIDEVDFYNGTMVITDTNNKKIRQNMQGIWNAHVLFLLAEHLRPKVEGIGPTQYQDSF